jgi:hypothetical protein
MSNAQQTENIDTTNAFVSYGPEPQFKGGLEAFYSFCDERIKNPTPGKEDIAPVWVKFFVDTEGKVFNLVILSSPGKEYENAVIQMFERVPAWIPAKKDESIIISEMTLPIFFN